MSSRVIKIATISPGTHKLVLVEIGNRCGASVQLLNCGATLVSARMPDRNGKFANVVLGMEALTDYLANPCYAGSTVGPYANRIAGARFCYGGREYRLDANNGRNCNHGGSGGFHQKWHDYELVEQGVIFRGEREAGEDGFPGNIRYSVAYTLNDNNTLGIEFRARTDQATPLNLSNHAYFNLAGDCGSISGHDLRIYSHAFLESDSEYIPSGRILNTQDGPNDFSEERNVGEMIQKNRGEGYNVCYIFQERGKDDMTRHATLREPQSGRALDVYSTYPGLQLYTGDFLTAPFKPFSGIALEAQYYPDSPNHKEFPSTILLPGKEYRHRIEYRFSTY